MLKNKELDGIVIASTSSYHCQHSVAALDKGFHVFSEKPLGLTISECKKVEKAVERQPDKVFFIGLMHRYDKVYKDAKNKITQKHIGNPILIRCYRLDPKKYVQSCIAFSNKSGGLFFDAGVHDIDIARWFVGSEPISVFSLGGCYLYQEFAKYNDIDNGSFIMKFKNGAMGFFYIGRTSAHGYHVETEIIGTNGTVKVGALNEQNEVTVYNEQGAVKEFKDWFIERYQDAYLNEKQEFVDCIQQGKKPEVTVYDATRAIEISFAARDSLLSQRLVNLE
jgi:myo-inositol 2-dehydrogenase/D-chiro-inositol 1-dehydrogenase